MFGLVFLVNYGFSHDMYFRIFIGSHVHKKRTILITTTYIESNLPSNAVAAVQSTERLLPGAGGAQNECVRYIDFRKK